jgi:hypothetical protein
MTENHTHFYASSVAQWATTTDERDLPDLLAMMEKDGLTYNLFLVPGKHTDPYEIAMYQPMVKGTQWLGTFTLPKKKGARK